MNFNPMALLLRYLQLLFTGRLSFPKKLVGTSLAIAGQEYVIFRQCVIKGGDAPEPRGNFVVRFRLANMGIKQNIRFSVLPIPFFVGLPGFCSKTWLYQPESGEFMGRYQWATIDAAKKYSESFAMRFMTRRAVPGSVC